MVERKSWMQDSPRKITQENDAYVQNEEPLVCNYQERLPNDEIFHWLSNFQTNELDLNVSVQFLS